MLDFGKIFFYTSECIDRLGVSAHCRHEHQLKEFIALEAWLMTDSNHDIQLPTHESPASTELSMLKKRLREHYCTHYKNKNVSIGDFTYGSPQALSWGEGTELKIGKFCSISSNVTIMLGGEHRPDWITTYPFNSLLPFFQDIKGHPMSKGDVIIGNDVWIGSDVKIMSGVTIEDGCVVASSALVTHNMPAYSIFGGIPAKLIRYRFSAEIIDKLLQIKWWDWSDDDVCKVIPFLQSKNFDALFQYYSEHITNM